MKSTGLLKYAGARGRLVPELASESIVEAPIVRRVNE